MGHSSVLLTSKTYVHHSARQLRGAAEMIRQMSGCNLAFKVKIWNIWWFTDPAPKKLLPSTPHWQGELRYHLNGHLDCGSAHHFLPITTKRPSIHLSMRWPSGIFHFQSSTLIASGCVNSIGVTLNGIQEPSPVPKQCWLVGKLREFESVRPINQPRTDLTKNYQPTPISRSD